MLDFLASGDITAGHARALLPLENENAVNEALDVVLAKQLSVRETEKLVKNLLARKEASEPEPEAADLDTRVYMEKLQERVTAHLGRKAFFAANAKKKGAGRLEIEYYSAEDLETLLKSLCGDKVFED